MENFEKMISEGVKKFVKEYYKKNPDEAWTDQEHELFLMGLRKYGRANYGKISRKFVKTKNLQQVKNHANLPILLAPRNVVVPDVADAASGTNGVVEPETNAIVVDQIIGTTNRTTTLDLFPTSEPKPTLIMFPVTAPTFPVRSETESSDVPPNYAHESNLQDTHTYGSTVGGDLFPSYGELDLDLHLGSWY
eukprot:XP_024449979.1 transcription factor MYB1R1 [Populus trichocarpa]